MPEAIPEKVLRSRKVVRLSRMTPVRRGKENMRQPMHVRSTRALAQLSSAQLSWQFSARFFARPLAAALATVAWLHAVPAANAQTRPQAPAAADQAVNIPDQKLDQAAAAIERMASIKQEYQQRISKGASQAEQQKLADEGNNAMEKAVTEQGLSVAEYSSILEVAQNNPVVREKIIQRITPKPAAPPPGR
jgi:hypothetical protein